MKVIMSLLLVIVITLTGCIGNEPKVSNLTMDNVVNAIKAEGPELFSKGQIDYFVLNKVKPNVFTIGYKTEDVARLENLYVYIFDSEEDRKKGLLQFNQQLQAIKLAAFPLVYEHKNSLVIYWSQKEKVSKFGDKIQAALTKI
jgi:hypothetical protein